MRKAVLISAFLGFSAVASFGQVIKPNSPAPSKPNPTPTPVKPAPPVAAPSVPGEIGKSEWDNIVTFLDLEDWGRATSLIQSAMAKLPQENEKKQLAQLRYLFLYALAGKAAGNELFYPELERNAANMADKEFVLPARQVLDNCKNSVNFICPVKGNDSVLRVTATNKSVTLIHSFEYVELPNPFNHRANKGRKAYVTAYLKKAEFNPRRPGPWIMRLYFDGGRVDVTTAK